jgi:hypothetical protein
MEKYGLRRVEIQVDLVVVATVPAYEREKPKPIP